MRTQLCHCIFAIAICCFRFVLSPTCIVFDKILEPLSLLPRNVSDYNTREWNYFKFKEKYIQNLIYIKETWVFFFQIMYWVVHAQPAVPCFWITILIMSWIYAASNVVGVQQSEYAESCRKHGKGKLYCITVKRPRF